MLQDTLIELSPPTKLYISNKKTSGIENINLKINRNNVIVLLGMYQHAGLSRELVTEPDLTLLDETFSALDALASKKRHTDFKSSMSSNSINKSSALIVTHDIYKAVEMAGRIIIMAYSPATIAHQIESTDIKYFNSDTGIVQKRIDGLFDRLEEYQTSCYQ